MARTTSGSELTAMMGTQVYFKARIGLDPAASPKTIDYRMTAGPTHGAVQLGIYEFRGDTLRFCFGPPNGRRPGEFTTVAGDGRTLSAWVAAKP